MIPTNIDTAAYSINLVPFSNDKMEVMKKAIVLYFMVLEFCAAIQSIEIIEEIVKFCHNNGHKYVSFMDKDELGFLHWGQNPHL